MSRTIIVADALKWLQTKTSGSLPNVVTGLCDLDETDMTLEQYLVFFEKVAHLIFEKLHSKGYAIFIQTDRKYEGRTIDKSHMLTSIADSMGCRLVWHKIVLHREVDHTDLHRPTYAHMLCYSYDGKPGSAFPDVLPVGRKLYKNGTPMNAAYAALEYIQRTNKVNHAIVDPFVGQGTIPAIANQLGMDAIGVDIDPQQADKAKTFTIR